MTDSSFDTQPAGKGMHEDEVWPGAALYVPRLHGLQTVMLDAPATLENLPGPQGSQLLDPSSEDQVPGGQRVHVKEPGDGEYEPGGQRTHTPDEFQKEPAAHASQPVDLLEGATVPLPHGMHSLAPAPE
jgi:hypothetical protein